MNGIPFLAILHNTILSQFINYDSSPALGGGCVDDTVAKNKKQPLHGGQAV